MSNIVSVSWERGPDASRLYGKTGNVCPTPPPPPPLLHLSFSTGMDFSSVAGRPLWRLWRFSDVLTSARCTQISRWMASLCGLSAVYDLPGSNVSRENPRSLASPLFNTRLFLQLSRLQIQLPRCSCPGHCPCRATSGRSGDANKVHLL